MRLLTEIVLALFLIIFAWEKPFKQWFGANAPPPHTAHVSPPATPPPLPVAPTTASWMWDANRKTSLDRGTYNQAYGVSHAPNYYFVGGGVPLLTDAAGRTYWVDSQGVKHYQP